MKTISLNYKFLLPLWGILAGVLLAWLIASYSNNFQVLAEVQEEQALNEVPKNLPVFEAYKSRGEGVLTLWFNNGWKSQYSSGLQELEKRKLKAAVSVVTSYTDYPGFLNWDEVKSLQNKGWEIVSQGKTYQCEWKNLNIDELRDNVYGAKRQFFARGIITENFASPCGAVDLSLSSMAAYYYSSQKIGEEGNNNLPLESVYTLKGRTVNSKTTLAEVEQWINQARNNNQWIILTFNQIAEGDEDFSITKEKFSKVIEKVAASGMDVKVPSQIIPSNKAEAGAER